MEQNRLDKCHLLQKLLRRYCELNGTEVKESLTTVGCTMPNGAFLKIYGRPMVEYCGSRKMFIYGLAEYPKRTKWRYLNLDDKGADYLCEKLNEKIKELENNI